MLICSLRDGFVSKSWRANTRIDRSAGDSTEPSQLSSGINSLVSAPGHGLLREWLLT